MSIKIGELYLSEYDARQVADRCRSQAAAYEERGDELTAQALRRQAAEISELLHAAALEKALVTGGLAG